MEEFKDLITKNSQNSRPKVFLVKFIKIIKVKAKKLSYLTSYLIGWELKKAGVDVNFSQFVI